MNDLIEICEDLDILATWEGTPAFWTAMDDFQAKWLERKRKAEEEAEAQMAMLFD